MKLDIFFSLLFLLLGIRTISWWLQNWQLREYRWDRLKANFATKDGFKNLLNLWFFKGILPRPHKSGRVLMILGILVFLSGTLFNFNQDTNILPLYLLAIIWERTIWLSLGISVLLSKIPVWIAQRILFYLAKKIIATTNNVTVIGITGSFGKSSTKELLVHLLKSKFSPERILWNPENQNNEIAIARLVLKNKLFFKGDKQKIFVVEIGAYRLGEIKRVCDFIQPQIGILTGLNAQHIALFGSQENIKKAKFELAESTSDKVFFNSDNKLLNEIFADKKIKATKLPISKFVAKNIVGEIDKTNFTVYGQNMVLPWAGEFFVHNALLAMEVAREFEMTPKEIALSLANLPPLPRALTMGKHHSGAVIIKDLYSANPDGVFSAIDHLGKFKGRKIFVSIPLLELGKKSKEIHTKIFQKLKNIDAEIFWLKKDFGDLGCKTCGKNFHGQDLQKLKDILKTLGKNDAILLESRLPKNVLQLFK